MRNKDDRCGSLHYKFPAEGYKDPCDYPKGHSKITDDEGKQWDHGVGVRRLWIGEFNPMGRSTHGAWQTWEAG